jgi:hypothetical protein
LQVRTFINVDTEPRKRQRNSLYEVRSIAFGVRIFDAKHQRAIVVTGEEPIEEAASRGTNVEKTSG